MLLAPDVLLFDRGNQAHPVKLLLGTGDDRLFERYWDNARGRWDWTDHGVPGSPTPLSDVASALTATATFTIAHPDPRVAAPRTVDVTPTATFTGSRTRVALGNLAIPPVGPFDTPLGSNTITITATQVAPGSFDPSSGDLAITVDMHFDHSLPDLFVGDSDVRFALTTGTATSPGGAFTVSGSSRNPATGAITLVGASRFTGGFLNNRECSLEISGVLSPIP